MKPWSIVGALVLVALLVGSGYGWRAHQDRTALHRADSIATLALAGQVAAAHALDSSQAASAAADSVRRAEDDRRVASRQQQAAQLGTAVTHLQDTAAILLAGLACPDSLATNLLRDVLERGRIAQLVHLAADSAAAVADSSRHAHDVAQIDSLQTTALPALRAQRDTALARERTNLARAIAAEWGEPRKIYTALSCAAAGIGLFKGNAPVGLGGGALCVGSLVLH